MKSKIMMPLISQNNWVRESRMLGKILGTHQHVDHLLTTISLSQTAAGPVILESYHLNFTPSLSTELWLPGVCDLLRWITSHKLNSIFETEDRHQLESVVIPKRLVGKNKSRETNLSAKTKRVLS